MKTKIKYIIGLGNPDTEYLNTRHNVGFMFLDFIAKKLKASEFVSDKKLGNGSYSSKASSEKSTLLLIKPGTYVNKSGEIVKSLKAKPENVLVIQDDLDIELGNSKLSLGKSSGGHKGVESIIKALKSKDFYRLRLGTATRGLKKARQQSDSKRDAFVQDFVLSKFTSREEEILKDTFKDAWEKVSNII